MVGWKVSWVGVAVGALAVVLGASAAAFDVAAPFGDDSAKGTILLWLAACGLFGFLRPRRPWRWALLVGLWVPATHLVLHALGLPHALNPNTYTTALLLVPVALAFCLVAAYAGSLVRYAAGRP
jgi:hypothetical protein